MTRQGTRVKLVSFDIDGTLEIGDPPGIIPIALVRRAQALGYLVGSCSDRPVSFQAEMWRRHEIAQGLEMHLSDDAPAETKALAEKILKLMSSLQEGA